MAKAKTINLLLDDGNLDGLLTIEDSSWDGIMFISPRESVKKLFEQEETSYWGVYLLISEEIVYIGQASELQRRIKQHDIGKDFWKKVVLITTKDDSLNRSAIDYIEHKLIYKAKKVESLHIENKQSGNKSKVSRFDKVKYDNFIENSLLLLELIGVKVFTQADNSRLNKGVAEVKDVEKSNEALEMAALYLYDGMSFRNLEINILGISDKENPRGFEARRILNDLGINAGNKGAVKANGYINEFKNATGTYKETLISLQEKLKNKDKWG